MARSSKAAREAMTLNEAAEFAGVGRKLMHRLAKHDPAFPVVWFGPHKARVLKSALVEYLSLRRDLSKLGAGA
jgi:hypothetical protein